MQGLVIVGTSPGTSEAEVANALRSAGPRPAVLETGGLVAARLAGAELDPESVIADARRAGGDADLLVVATSGGLMAPLTERYANRDLARELGLPLVLAVPAGEGMVGPALLTLESALGSGLGVAGIAIAGWPDPPSRTLIEERALLERM